MLSEPLSKKKTALFAAIAAVGALIFLEVFASWFQLLRMRLAQTENFTKVEPTYFSLINIPYKTGLRFGLFQPPPDEYTENFEPHPAREVDAELGFKPIPGRYRVTFSHRAHGGATWERAQAGANQWERVRTIETRNSDGTRWTGECQPNSPNVYIFGDSWAAGYGVNDQQTFAFLLQHARKDICVRLFAVGGYGMTQAFIQFHQLRSQIRPNDIVILGYGDYFGHRTAVVPSFLREISNWFKRRGIAEERVMRPSPVLDDRGAIHITYVQQRCDENDGYCNQADPSNDEITHLMAALINEIAEKSGAPVYLLHYEGSKENPIFGFLSSSVRRISALNEDFDYSIRDDIMGFDKHPGPFWHYAISRKLIEALK